MTLSEQRPTSLTGRGGRPLLTGQETVLALIQVHAHVLVVPTEVGLEEPADVS